MKTGWCIWVTGLPGSGKSTMANFLIEKLKSSGVSAQKVSMDMLRAHATPQPTYSEKERTIVYGALVFTAKMLTENNINVIIDATGNRRRYRDHARQTILRFMEAYLECPLEVCMRRESTRKNTHLAPTNIYVKAKMEKTSTVPGFNVPYEAPLNPEIKVDSSLLSVGECSEKILVTAKKHFHKI